MEPQHENPSQPEKSLPENSTSIPSITPPPYMPSSQFQSAQAQVAPQYGTMSSPAPGFQTDSNKSYLTTFMLSLFLGWVGADRFYLGKIGTAILKLITIGGYGIWTLIDLILIMTNDTTDIQGNKLRDREKYLKLSLIMFGAYILGTFISVFLTFFVR